MNWQRANVQAAATYLRERIAAGATDARTRAIYEGLLDVLDPNRRAVRQQQDMAAALRGSVPVAVPRERRSQVERRSRPDRRVTSLGPTGGTERRSGRERRSGKDRRSH